MNATPKFLLEGSYYALFQCGRLLTSAAILYKAGEYATAVGLAALAHEELGRSRYLKDQRKRVICGGSVSVEKIRKTCRDHELKQEWGQSSVFQRFSVDSGLGKLLENRRRAAPRSKERQEYDRQVDEITDKQKGRTPQDRHNERMKAIYVEPNDHGTDWNKPWERDKEAAQYFIENALSNYKIQRNSVWVPEILELDDPELAQAVEAWKDRPALPPPPSLY